jgi:hypothetical protein
MTPAQQAKSVGLNSLTQVSNETGVSLNTLTNWHRDKPELFKTVLSGVKALKPKPSGELTREQIKDIIEDGEYWDCGRAPYAWSTSDRVRFCLDVEDIIEAGSELDLKICDVMRDEYLATVRSLSIHGEGKGHVYFREFTSVIMDGRVCDIIEEIVDR